MATVSKWRPDFKNVREKEVDAYKTTAENVNIRKSTINWLKVFANLELL